ncbi:MAG: YeeE/YedE thiosulfate transporter family protein [Azospirillaceae bacterium]|nr:YeeE/YedE thiosulfate transporter family protein [Azospirillaceae bacterium]
MIHDFSPISALLGGIAIGLAAAVLWSGLGRIAGISGILGGLATARRGDIAWRIAFLLGMIAAPPLLLLAGGSMPTITVTSAPGLLIAGGLLVGFGTRLGGGCTSGHGVCGLARGSRRSIVATALFMAAAATTVFLVRHLIGALS